MSEKIDNYEMYLEDEERIGTAFWDGNYFIGPLLLRM